MNHSIPAPAGGPPTDATPDVYRIDVTPARKGRSRGWRVQVYALDSARPGGEPCLTEATLPWRIVGLWRGTRAGALHLGISEAHEIHGAAGTGRPLLIWHEGEQLDVQRLREQLDQAHAETVRLTIALDAAGGAR